MKYAPTEIKSPQFQVKYKRIQGHYMRKILSQKGKAMQGGAGARSYHLITPVDNSSSDWSGWRLLK
jgi:hypothetical protein